MRTFLEQLLARVTSLRDIPNASGRIAAEMHAIAFAIDAKLHEPLDAEDENETLKSDLAATLDAGDSMAAEARVVAGELEHPTGLSAFDLAMLLGAAAEEWDSYKAALAGEPTVMATVTTLTNASAPTLPGTQQVPS